jgi:hypothetical protein
MNILNAGGLAAAMMVLIFIFETGRERLPDNRLDTVSPLVGQNCPIHGTELPHPWDRF